MPVVPVLTNDNQQTSAQIPVRPGYPPDFINHRVACLRVDYTNNTVITRMEECSESRSLDWHETWNVPCNTVIEKMTDASHEISERHPPWRSKQKTHNQPQMKDDRTRGC